MQPQKIQPRLGNYLVLGKLSRGSTSQVFKVRYLPQQSKTGSHVDQTSEIVTIDMTYDLIQNSQESEEQVLDFTKKDMILKLYNLRMMVNDQNQFLDIVKYDIFVEGLFLSYLHHPGIIKPKEMLLEYQLSPNKGQDTNPKKKLIRAGIVMEICEKGCFNALVHYINRTMLLREHKLQIMRFYLCRVANTLIYLNQQCKILHRDIKAQNIMVNKQLDIKVIDYGVSKITVQILEKVFTHPQKQLIFNLFNFDQNITLVDLFAKIKQSQSQRKNMIGSMHYISPQLIEKYRSDMELVDQAYQKTDIWSFGVLVYKIFHDKYPFEGRNLRQVQEFIMNDKYMPQLSPQLPQMVKQVIVKCFVRDYSQRPSWKQLMELEFFSQIPANQIFTRVSPIRQLLDQQKRNKQSPLEKFSKILFDEKLTLKYEDQTRKSRRVLIGQQKDSKKFKFFILKQNETVSFSFELIDHFGVLIKEQEDCLEAKFYHDKDHVDCFKIMHENQKELQEKFMDSLHEAFKTLRQREQEDLSKNTYQTDKTTCSLALDQEKN